MKNTNYAQKLLNPVIKYTKCSGTDDCFISKEGYKTNQKIFRNREKETLINYIKKRVIIFIVKNN